MVLPSSIAVSVIAKRIVSSLDSYAVGAMLAISAMACYVNQHRISKHSMRYSQSTTKNMPKQVIRNIHTLPAVPPFGSDKTPLLEESYQHELGLSMTRHGLKLTQKHIPMSIPR